MPLTFLRSQAEVQIENLQTKWRLTASIYLDGGVLAATAFEITHRKIDVAFAHDGIAAEGSIAVTAFPQADIVTCRVVGIAQRCGELPRHVLLTGARCSFVNFLEQHDIRIVITENPHDTVGLEPPVETDGTVDIVRDDAQPSRRGLHVATPGNMAAARASDSPCQQQTVEAAHEARRVL